ncbi:MAG: ATP-binding protein [Deltaproteobacteria bacterium]|nr:ATP-binding protein [Deltaproteobacteria bacterium]
MVLIAGPRQVGKTTLALQFLQPSIESHPAYFNWDVTAHRPKMRNGEFPQDQPTIILDEIHKYARWKTLTKGFYDQYKSQKHFIITGSAKLNHYSRGGDSQLGRSWFYRLHPFSLMEFNSSPTQKDLEYLLKFGGFPDPLFKGSEEYLRRWSRERIRRILQDDLRDLERVRELSLVESLVDLLPSRVGSPLSIKSLREDLEVAHATVENWLRILENLYVCYRIPPFGSTKIRAVKKEQKLYLWDWSSVEEPGARFENFVANQLLKYCHLQEDAHGYRMELRYVRDTDKREVDFVVLQENRPEFAVECKLGEKNISPALYYFSERTKIARFFQVHLGTRDTGIAAKNVRILPWIQFCKELKMP